MTTLSWVATYKDGTKQTKNYDQLIRQNLVNFKLLDESGKQVLSLDLDSEKKLFYRKRGTIPFHWMLHLVGWRTRTKNLIYVIDDTGVQRKEKFESFWHEPQWTSQEQV